MPKIALNYVDETGPVTVEVEYQWLNAQQTAAPLVVFLHEGLGSVAMWKDFPQQFCDAAQCRGLVFSRPGYGQSSPRAEGQRWAPEHMHYQATAMLPALLAVLQVQGKPWLFGHSDGGTISLQYAAQHSAQLSGIVVVAPHIFVEAISLRSIDVARAAYENGDLRARLARYHADVDSAFWGWNDMWLNPAFATWHLRDVLPRISCPLLAIQGEQDEYGTMAQIEGIAQAVPHAQLYKLTECGHSPHRDQPQKLMAKAIAFIHAQRPHQPAHEASSVLL